MQVYASSCTNIREIQLFVIRRKKFAQEKTCAILSDMQVSLQVDLHMFLLVSGACDSGITVLNFAVNIS